MFVERSFLSEFANRLSNTDVNSLDGVLYLLGEYEVALNMLN